MPEKTVLNQIEWTHVWLAAITALWGGPGFLLSSRSNRP